MSDGWKALNEMQGSGKSEEDISISPGALDESQNHVRRHTNPSRTRDQSVREWVQKGSIEPDPNGFEEGNNGSDVISEYLRSNGDDPDIDYEDVGGLSVNVTQEGVTSVAQELYEQDLITVETPEMDRSGVSGQISLSVDQDRIGEYMEEIRDEFGASGDPKASASAAVALGMESVFQAVNENYDGDVGIDTFSSGKPQSDIPSSETPSWDVSDDYDGKVVGDASYIPEAADAAMDTYEDNVFQAEVEKQRGERQEEDDGGLLGRFL